MATIWRLEDRKTKRGIYTVGAACATDNGLLSDTAHPGPGNDPGFGSWWKDQPYSESSRWWFGFATLTQYKNWFNTRSDRKRLSEWGDGRIVLRKYQVPDDDFKRGDKQAIFLRDNEVLLEERSPAYC